MTAINVQLIDKKSLVTQFFDIVKHLIALGHEVNHSESTTKLAINIDEYYRHCQDLCIAIPDRLKLKKALIDNERHLLMSVDVITSAITQRPVRCWIFDVSEA